jgi:8-oxo-dGTP pyrophosphatase MutT (NUDIX family)
VDVDVIRQAATVIPVRPGRAGVEVLVMRRGGASRFLPGYVVFPGGAVDVGDAALADRWFGSETEAPRAAAVRELAEETGLAVTAGGVRSAPGVAAALAAVEQQPPPSGNLPQISRWIAPDDVPVRFDARYFAVAAAVGVDPRPDGHEAEEVWWADPREIMSRWAADRERLYWPTMKTMEALARCEDVDRLLSLTIPQQEPVDGDEERMPRSTFWED